MLVQKPLAKPTQSIEVLPDKTNDDTKYTGQIMVNGMPFNYSLRLPESSSSLDAKIRNGELTAEGVFKNIEVKLAFNDVQVNLDGPEKVFFVGLTGNGMSKLFNGVPLNSENAKRVAVSVSERGLYEYAVELYRDNNAFIREALQNATDANATKLDIKVSKNKISIVDNGEGMSRQFLETEFSSVGNKFKSNGEIGRFGVGRFSYWLPILWEEDGKVHYNGRITITSSTEKETTRLVWDKLQEYSISSCPPNRETGTEIVIERFNDLGDGKGAKAFDKEQISKYIADTVVSTNLNIQMNNSVIPLPNSRKFMESGTMTMYNSIKGIIVGYPYEATIGEESDIINIAENGIMVSHNYLPIGGTVNFFYAKSPNGDGNLGITTLNRDSLAVRVERIQFGFINQVLLPNYLRRPIKDLKKSQSALLHLAEILAHNDYFSPLLSYFPEIIVMRGRTLAKWAEKDKVLWAPESYPKLFLERAKSLGYTVLVDSNGGIALREIFEQAGIMNISTIKSSLTQQITIRGAKNAKEKLALKKCTGYLRTLQEVMKRIKLQNTDPEFYAGSLDEEQFFPHDEVSQEPVEVLSTIEEGGVKLHMATHSNPDTVAFFYNGAICFNVENKLVDKALRTKRFDLLIQPLVHEYTHKLGYTTHDDAFVRACDTIYIEFMLNVIEDTPEPMAKKSKKLLRTDKKPH